MEHVRPGDRLKIKAADWNAIADAVRAYEANRFRTEAGSTSPPSDTMLVRNETSVTVERFGVLGLDGPVITPAANREQFSARILMRGVTPTAEHVGRFAVLLEPAKPEGITRACLDGVCIGNVRMAAAGDQFADVTAGQRSWLQSASAGLAQILWIEPGAAPYTGLAVLRIGAAGGGGGTAWCVVTAANGTEPFVRVREVARYAAGGTYHAIGDPFAVWCQPGRTAADYSYFIVPPNVDWSPSWIIFPCVKIDGDWYVQWVLPLPMLPWPDGIFEPTECELYSGQEG